MTDHLRQNVSGLGKVGVVVPEGCTAWIQENVAGWWQWYVEGQRGRAHGECDTEEEARDIIRLLVRGVRA